MSVCLKAVLSLSPSLSHRGLVQSVLEKKKPPLVTRRVQTKGFQKVLRNRLELCFLVIFLEAICLHHEKQLLDLSLII